MQYKIAYGILVAAATRPGLLFVEKIQALPDSRFMLPQLLDGGFQKQCVEGARHDYFFFAAFFAAFFAGAFFTAFFAAAFFTGAFFAAVFLVAVFLVAVFFVAMDSPYLGSISFMWQLVTKNCQASSEEITRSAILKARSGFLYDTIHVIGGGLAGTEAAWQIAKRGHNVVLHEMRPVRRTPAHQTDRLAELVCSNSLKSESENTAPWLLKEELRRLDSLLLRAADQARVPGGHALTVDREIFASAITGAIAAEPRIELRREEVTAVPADAITVIASGPLTSDALSQEI